MSHTASVPSLYMPGLLPRYYSYCLLTCKLSTVSSPPQWLDSPFKKHSTNGGDYGSLAENFH